MDQGPNKYGGGGGQPSINDTGNYPYAVYIGKVISTTDDSDGGRIRARIYGMDGSISDDDPKLSAIPLLPKFIGIMPKKGESVFIFVQDQTRQQGERFWVGPIISQPQFLNEDPHFFTSRSIFKSGGLVAPDVAPSKVATANGIYPKKEEIAFQGRDNTDLIFRPRQVVIRAGKFLIDKPKGSNIPVYNGKNPAYFKLAYNTPINKTDSTVTKGSLAAMVAEKLLLVTFGGKKNDFKEFKPTEPNVELTDNTILELLSKAEPAVYGYVLVEFLKLFKEYAAKHNHNYPGNPPVQDKVVQDVLGYDLNKLLAENIRLV